MRDEALKKLEEIEKKVDLIKQDVERFTDRNVSKKELAGLWGVEDETIGNYTKYHNLPRLKNGKYPLRKCYDWLYESHISSTREGKRILKATEVLFNKSK